MTPLLQATTFLLVIILGIRLHGIGIGLLGSLGLLIITLLDNVTPTQPPFSLLLMIMATTTAAASLEITGTLDLVSHWGSKFFVHHPHLIIWISATTTYLIILLLGTSYIMYAILPILVRLAKKAHIKPVQPLVACTLAAELAVLASPSSAQFIIIRQFFNTITTPTTLKILIPSTLSGTLTATLAATQISKTNPYITKPYKKHPTTTTQPHNKYNIAHISLIIFAIAILLLMISENIAPPHVNPIHLKSIILMSVAATIALFTGTDKIVHAHTFQVGMQSVIALCGIAWLSNTLLNHHQHTFNTFATQHLKKPTHWMILLFIFTTITSSQATTLQMLLNKQIMHAQPTWLYIIPAVNSFYLLPSAPLILAAMTTDDTGTTKRKILHAFLLPGLIGTTTSIIIAKIITQHLII